MITRGLRVTMLGLALLGCGVALAEPPPQVEFQTGKGLPAGLPFSTAVRVGKMLYLSGQVGLVPGEMKLVPGGIREQTTQVMDGIATVLAANGIGFDDVVKCTAMLADMSEWGTFNDVYRTYFTKHVPARSAFGATGLALGARVELECMAVLRD